MGRISTIISSNLIFIIMVLLPNIVLSQNAFKEQTTEYIHDRSDSNYIQLVVFDGNELGELVQTHMIHLYKHQKVPNFKIIKIDNKDRWNELQPSKKDTTDIGNQFFKYVSEELINPAKYNLLVGHSLSAKFALDLAMSNPNVNFILAVSPPIIPSLEEKLLTKNYSSDLNFKSVIYTSSNDLSFHLTSIQNLEKKLDKNDHFCFVNLKNDQLIHSLLPMTTIPDGLISFASEFSDFSFDYLDDLDKATKENQIPIIHSQIIEKYRIPWTPSLDFIMYYFDFCIENENLPIAKELADLAIKTYECSESYYLYGHYFESKKEYESALKMYQKGFELLPDDILNIEDFEEDIIRVKKHINK